MYPAKNSKFGHPQHIHAPHFLTLLPLNCGSAVRLDFDLYCILFRLRSFTLFIIPCKPFRAVVYFEGVCDSVADRLKTSGEVIGVQGSGCDSGEGDDVGAEEIVSPVFPVLPDHDAGNLSLHLNALCFDVPIFPEVCFGLCSDSQGETYGRRIGFSFHRPAVFRSQVIASFSGRTGRLV